MVYFCTLVSNKMFKVFDCSELFSTPCCPDRDEERFCFMRNDPSQVGAVLRVEVRSCCLHAHEVKKLPIEFYIKHHRPYVDYNAPKPKQEKVEKVSFSKAFDISF